MKNFLILLFITVFSLALSARLVSAQNVDFENTGGTQVTIENSSSCIPGSGQICLSNPLGNIDTPQSLIGRVINSVLGIVGSLALLMFVYGGLTWMTSSGNQEKVKKGRDILVWSAIGLVVIFMAYALTRLLLSSLAQ